MLAKFSPAKTPPDRGNEIADDMEEPRGVPDEVELPGRGERDVADFADALGSVLKRAPLFRREDVAVTVDATSGEIRLMTPDRFVTWVAQHARIVEAVEVGRANQRQTMRVKRTLPMTTAKICLQSDQFQKHLRPLVRVNLVPMPVIRHSGSIELLKPGYDEESQIFTIKSGVSIDEGMTLEAAQKTFAGFYGEFHFTDVRSLSVAITMPLALFGMGLQPVEEARMGFMVRANTQGGGKSLVAQMAITPSFGLPENTAKANEDELRKILDAVVLQGVPYLFFDNLKGHFENALVEGFMTTPVWRARVMGTQRFMRGKVCSVLMITGNNLTVSPDLQRRMLQCDIFIEEFDLQERRHARNLSPHVLSHPGVRSEFLSALWALIRNWDARGRPPAGTPANPYRVATFSEWSDIFGGVMQAAGYANPLHRPPDDQAAAPITVHQRRLIELLSFGLAASKPVLEYTFQELVDCCHENELFSWKMKGRLRSEEGDEWFELQSDSASVMGLMFTREMGDRKFTLGDGRCVKFGKSGEGRARRYSVNLAPPSVATAAAA